MSSRQWCVGVVVPARDEEGSIEGCVRAIRESWAAASTRISQAWIVVVADSCSDRTAARASAAIGSHGRVVECQAQSPGIARRLGTEAVLERFHGTRINDIWIANTDADSSPHPDWIGQQLCLADQGYCGVAGIVEVDSVTGLESHEAVALLDDYVINEDGSHPHVHGANLGLRADAYLDAGGWSSLALAEDHCLWKRVRARQWRVISSTASIVTTSGRLVGRAVGGFADGLRRRLELRYG
jgi:cellulose synthase/poly-beta-1,6-N-acetylglucosamine synthase-like glycosyltransferase